MKCDELKVYECTDEYEMHDGSGYKPDNRYYYSKNEVDKAIDELREATRWRKCSEEMPQNYDDGDEFLIAVEHESTTCPKGYYVAIAELVGGEWSDDEGRDIDEDIEYDLEDSDFCSQAPQGTKKGFYHSKVTHWMPLPKAPEDYEVKEKADG